MPAWQNELSGADRDAAAALIALFKQYGLESLGPKIVDFIQQGYGQDTIVLLLQETKEYQERFRGNQLRASAGLPVLTPGDYLRIEAGYRQALQAAGMPAGFYDSPSDFHDFIAKDIAPEEIAERANEARRVADTVDPLQRQVLGERLGITHGDLAAYFLDTDKALGVLERNVQQALLGAERQRAGFEFDQGQAESLFSQGISIEEARRGYGTIAEVLPTFEKLGEIEGDEFTVSDLEAEVFGSSGEAATRRQRLASQERARFSGSAGTGQNTLSRQRQFQ